MVTNTIIAGNQSDCADLSAGASSGGHNLAGDTTCGALLTAAGDSSGDPQLGPLQDNGGPTPTMALVPGSPAVDAGDDAACPPTDQRGVSRPQGPHCDIGAFELAATSALTTTAVGSSSNPSVVDQTVTFTATVAPSAPATGMPSGTVAFSDAAGVVTGCGAQPLVSGQATCPATFTSALAADVVTAA